MMLRVSASALIICVVISISSPALATDRSAIQAQSRKLDRAFEKRDFRVWWRVLAPSFTASGPNSKTLTKEEYIDEAKSEARAALPPISVRNKLVSLRVQGGSADARWREFTCYGFRHKDRIKHRLCYRQFFRDEWRKTGTEWQATRTVYSVGSKFFLDGRLVGRQQIKKMLAN